MHHKGHLGLALLVMSLIAIPFGYGPDYVVVLIVVLSAGISWIPDIDLNWEIAHRKLTHNILFALIIGIFFGTIFGYSSGLLYGLIGFIGGFMGVMLHLLGDLMTHMKFKPLWPIKNNEIAWHWFYSDSETANKGFFTLGVIAFFVYVFIASGALNNYI